MFKSFNINFENKDYPLFQNIINDEKVYALIKEEESKWLKNKNEVTFKVKALEVDVIKIDQKGNEIQYRADITNRQVEVDSDQIKHLTVF